MKLQPVKGDAPKSKDAPAAGRPAKAPEMKLVFEADWEKPIQRMRGVRGLLVELAAMAEARPAA